MCADRANPYARRRQAEAGADRAPLVFSHYCNVQPAHFGALRAQVLDQTYSNVECVVSTGRPRTTPLRYFSVWPRGPAAAFILRAGLRRGSTSLTRPRPCARRDLPGFRRATIFTLWTRLKLRAIPPGSPRVHRGRADARYIDENVRDLAAACSPIRAHGKRFQQGLISAEYKMCTYAMDPFWLARTHLQHGKLVSGVLGHAGLGVLLAAVKPGEQIAIFRSSL